MTRAAGGSFRVATYNLKNLFLDTGSAILNAKRRARPKRRVELRALARTIGRLDADLLAVQEVGDGAALTAVNELLGQPYPHLEVVPGNSDRGIHLGFLSRVPVSLTSHAELLLADAHGQPLADFATAADAEAGLETPLRLQRDLLRCDVLDGALTVYNVHLKSPNQPRWRRLDAATVRAAEARLIAGVLAAPLAERERALLLVGDFNEGSDGEALAPLRRAGLHDVAGKDAEQVPTFWPACARIDHVFANTTALRRVEGDLQVHASRRARRASDHFPVSVALRLS